MTLIPNPAVRSAAEQFTDGAVTDEVLKQVAQMHGLPLVIPATRGLSDIDSAIQHHQRQREHAETMRQAAMRRLVRALEDLAEAKDNPKHLISARSAQLSVTDNQLDLSRWNAAKAEASRELAKLHAEYAASAATPALAAE